MKPERSATAGELDADRAAVEQIVGEADELAAVFRDQRMHGLVWVEEPRPGHPGDLRWQGREARAAVEGVVAVPERQPLREIRRRHRANDRRAGSRGHASPVGTIAAVSAMRITVRSVARVRWTTPFGTTKPWLGSSSIDRPSRSMMK